MDYCNHGGIPHFRLHRNPSTVSSDRTGGMIQKWQSMQSRDWSFVYLANQCDKWITSLFITLALQPPGLSFELGHENYQKTSEYEVWIEVKGPITWSFLKERIYVSRLKRYLFLFSRGLQACWVDLLHTYLPKELFIFFRSVGNGKHIKQKWGFRMHLQAWPGIFRCKHRSLGKLSPRGLHGPTDTSGYRWCDIVRRVE